MNKTMYRQTEAKLKTYFESLIIRESLNYRLKMLNRHKKELEDSFSEAKDCATQLEEIKTQVSKLNSNLRLLEQEFSDVEYLLGTLSERDKQIVINRYRDKKTYRSIGFSLYLSESRVHQIRCDILKYLFNKLQL